VGSGGRCGSISLDRAFLDLVRRRVGDAFGRWPAKKTGRDSRLTREFEAAKRDFGTREHTEPWLMPLGNIGDNPQNQIEAGEMRLTVYFSNDFCILINLAI
jgi:hypothetical protein